MSLFKKTAVAVAVVGALASGVAMAADSDKVYEGLNNSNYGGALSSSSSLVLDGYTFTGNVAKGKDGTTYNGGQGGAVYSSSADLTVSDSTFNGNRAVNGTSGASQPKVTKGGAIYHQYGQLEVTDSTFTANTSENNGGAIAANGSTSDTVVIIKDSVFGGEDLGNSTAQHGGAVHIQGANVILSGNTFANNTAGGRGGAILFRDSAVAKFEGENTFVGNSAGTGGGALNAHQSGAEVTFAAGSVTTFEKNTAVKIGGAIRNDVQVTFEEGSTAKFVGNQAKVGGAIANTDEDRENPILKLEGTSVFEGNIASSHGGAIYNAGTLTVDNASFSKNKVENTASGETHGGAIYNVGGKVDIANSVFDGNSAYLVKDGQINYTQGHGGAIYSRQAGAELTITNSEFTGNKTGKLGGAIYVSETKLVSSSNTYEANEANAAGVMYLNTVNDATFTGDTFTGNKALTGEAGVMSFDKSIATFVDSVFTNNSAAGKGGALMVHTTSAITFNGTNTFSGNIAGSDANDIHNNGIITFGEGSVTHLAGGITGDDVGSLAGTGSIVITDAGAIISGQKEIAETLAFSATGSVNDAVGGDIEGLSKSVGVEISSMEEGDVMGAVSIDAEGNVVRKVNSIMSNVLDLASNSTLSMNRILMNDVRKRMGDLRSAEGTHGVWARYDGGKLSGSNGYENDFSTVQIGVDTVPAAGAPRFGMAFSYTTSDADMKRGGAEMDAFSLAFYGTKMYDNGLFVDVIGRMATADTDVVVDGDKKGSMDNVALSMSGEIGWRFDVPQKFYVEPQAELTYTYVDSDTLTLNRYKYDFDSVDSLIGRVGFAAGFKCPNNKGDVYVRASAVHEFLGDATVRGGKNSYTVDGKDTWVEFGIGANFNVNKSTYIYADIERTSGAKLEEDWRANVGLRYSF